VFVVLLCGTAAVLCENTDDLLVAFSMAFGTWLFSMSSTLVLASFHLGMPFVPILKDILSVVTAFLMNRTYRLVFHGCIFLFLLGEFLLPPILFVYRVYVRPFFGGASGTT